MVLATHSKGIVEYLDILLNQKAFVPEMLFMFFPLSTTKANSSCFL